MIIIAYSITTSQEVLGCVHLAPFNSSNAHGFCVVASRSKDKTIAKHITNVQWLHFSFASPGVGESEIRARAKLGQIKKFLFPVPARITFGERIKKFLFLFH